MKRVLCIALCALAALLACSCDDAKTVPTAATETEAATEAATEAPATADSPKPTEKGSRHSLKAFISNFDTTVTADERIVYKDADLEVKTTGIDYSSAVGPELKLCFKNNFGKDITVQAPYAVVNGYMVKPDMSVDIPYAKNGEGTLTLPYFSLSLADITCLQKIEFSLRIVETQSFNPITKTEIITVTTSADQDAEPEYDESGQVAYDDNDIKIVLKGVNTDRGLTDGAELVVYMYNGTDRNIAIQTGDVKVNGYDMTSVMNRSILPGKRAVDAVTIFAQDLDEHSIDEIDSVKVSFIIKDADSWEDIDSTELISVQTDIGASEAQTDAETAAQTE